jgi:hypothetical protein
MGKFQITIDWGDGVFGGKGLLWGQVFYAPVLWANSRSQLIGVMGYSAEKVCCNQSGIRYNKAHLRGIHR